MTPQPAIYHGTLTHRRYGPVANRFTYPLFMVCLDIDRIDETLATSRLSSRNRWNWASFDDRDHTGDPSRPLRERLIDDAQSNGIELPAGPIFLLTHLRYLGYGFNPVSFYYCYDTAGTLRVILAEVSNTYGGRQNYWLTDAAADPRGRSRRYRATKAMYVSPFNRMAQEYTFAFTEPAERLIVHMAVAEEGRQHFTATLRLAGEPWSPGALRRALVRHPWMTASVVTKIHWQALRLWLRGLPVVPRGPDAAPDVAGGQVLGTKLTRRGF